MNQTKSQTYLYYSAYFQIVAKQILMLEIHANLHLVNQLVIHYYYMYSRSYFQYMYLYCQCAILVNLSFYPYTCQPLLTV